MNENIKELIEEAVLIYGKRFDTEHKCTYCKRKIENNDYCVCAESRIVNIIAKRINKKWALTEDLKLIGENYTIINKIETPKGYSGMELEDFKTKNKEQQIIKNKFLNYYEKSVSNYLLGGNLILSGSSGGGKTLLLSILCNNLVLEKQFTVKFVNIGLLLDELKKSYSDGTPKSEKDVIDVLISADFLIIDDIDKFSQDSDWAKNILFKIIDSRYNDIRPTCISSNLNMVQLTKLLGEPCLSRLVQKGQVILFDLPNERYNNQK